MPGPGGVQSNQCYMGSTTGPVQSQRLSVPGPPRYEPPNQNSLQPAAHLQSASPQVGQPEWHFRQNYGHWPNFQNQSSSVPRPAPVMSTPSIVASAGVFSQQPGARELRPPVMPTAPPASSALRTPPEYASEHPPLFLNCLSACMLGQDFKPSHHPIV